MVRFPDVAGRSLLGVEFALPGDLPADRTLAVVAFRQRHQPCVDRWIARAVDAGVPPTIRGSTGDLAVAVLELPVLSGAWRPVRRFIDGGMSSGIGDPDVLARTVTLYTDVTKFQRPLEIAGSDEVQALVLTRTGIVLARGVGEPSESSWAEVSAALFG